MGKLLLVITDIDIPVTSGPYGLEMSIGTECHLTSLCFADDVVLLTANAHQLREMMGDLKRAAAARGLKIHSGKTKILTNASALSGQRVPSSIKIDDESYAVLGFDESTKYLGRKVCFQDPHQTEFDNRVAKAWGAFSKHKQELTDRRHSVRNRLRLFDAVVSSTLLYGCETWTLRTDQERRLTVLQKKMLRVVLNAKRRTVASSSSEEESEETEEGRNTERLEPWRDFLKRTAEWTDEQLKRASLEPWSAHWRRRKWMWVTNLLEAGNCKWSTIATQWQPLLHSKNACVRRQARPKRRWDQDFIDYLGTMVPEEERPWQELAKDEDWWLSHVDSFATFASPS